MELSAALSTVLGPAAPALGPTLAPSPELAEWSNVALYSAMAVYTIALLLFAGHLAALGPVDEPEPEPLLVGAGSTPTREAGEDLAGPGGSDSVGEGAEPDGPGASARARRFGATGVSMTWLATGLAVVSVVLRGAAVMRPPWGNMFEFATAGATAAALGYLLLVRSRRWEWLGVFVVGPVLLTLGVALLAFYTEAAELMPALKSIWLIIHVVVAILAVAAFIIAFGLGVAYLLRHRFDAERQEPESTRRVFRMRFLGALPRSSTLERAAYGVNLIGFILWTFTLVAGAIWAQKAWGSYWTWDPKEVWTFVVWVVYAAYMHARATAGWEPRKAMWIAMAGFFTVVINFAVVNVFFVGQHSYSGL